MDKIETAAELIVQEAFEEGPGELSSTNPMVLSCGGIYIPRRRRAIPVHPLWHILNLPDNEGKSKVVSDGVPKSPLAAILEKENMN